MTNSSQIPRGFIEVGIRYSPIATELNPVLIAISNIAKVMAQEHNPKYTAITLYSKVDGKEEIVSAQGSYEQIVADIKRQSHTS